MSLEKNQFITGLIETIGEIPIHLWVDGVKPLKELDEDKHYDLTLISEHFRKDAHLFKNMSPTLIYHNLLGLHITPELLKANQAWIFATEVGREY